MASFRSAETIQKERELQAEHTVQINGRLQEVEDPVYRETLEDLEVFANVLRKYVPDSTLVLLHERPEIVLIAETEKYKVSLFVNGRCWRFKVNDSVRYSSEDVDKFGPSRMLKKIWDVVLDNLPENFVIKGIMDTKGPEEEIEARTRVLTGLGFGPPQEKNHLYGIVKNKILHPLTLEEFSELTQISTEQLSQKFNVRSITWPGA
jgi:hypothetical protein